jgi:hypothetical protein
LVAKDQVGIVSSVTLAGEKKERVVERVDNFVPMGTIANIISTMRKELVLDQAEFNKIHRFPGNKYLDYFGEKPEFGTICAIPKLHFSKAPVVQDLWYNNKLSLKELSDEDKDQFNSKDAL